MAKDKKEKKPVAKALKNQNVGEGTYDPKKTYVVRDGCAVETLAKGTRHAGDEVRAKWLHGVDHVSEAKMKVLVEEMGILVEGKKKEPEKAKDGE